MSFLLVGHRLLELPYCTHRRGTWFNRLILDTATHLHKPVRALQMARMALTDPALRTGHYYSLILLPSSLVRSFIAGV
jgi:hypothetical protein